jgi:hypothetical protein
VRARGSGVRRRCHGQELTAAAGPRPKRTRAEERHFCVVRAYQVNRPVWERERGGGEPLSDLSDEIHPHNTPNVEVLGELGTTSFFALFLLATTSRVQQLAMPV